MLLMIDNYDSFTYNLVQYFGELGERVTVYRNDQLTLNDVDALAPSHVVISPGPCTPNEAGISVDLVREYGARIPILGVCLGHQSIAQAYGGNIVRALRDWLRYLLIAALPRICVYPRARPDRL